MRAPGEGVLNLKAGPRQGRELDWRAAMLVVAQQAAGWVVDIIQVQKITERSAMGYKPMPTEGSQQPRVVVNVITEFCGIAAGPQHIGDSVLFGRRARSQGRQGG